MNDSKLENDSKFITRKISWSALFLSETHLVTRLTLNVNKKFRRRSVRLLTVLCTLNLRLMQKQSPRGVL